MDAAHFYNTGEEYSYIWDETNSVQYIVVNVRGQVGCEIGEHIHPGQWALPEGLHGKGAYLIDGTEVAYAPRISAAIPALQ